MSDVVHYRRIAEGEHLPNLQHFAPFKAVLILEDIYSAEWQNEVSEWLIANGCLYMMAWGDNCGSWDDSVDWANLERFNYGPIPDDQSVMTTWHDNTTLEEVFEFAQLWTFHPKAHLSSSVLIHISKDDREDEMVRRFAAANPVNDN